MDHGISDVWDRKVMPRWLVDLLACCNKRVSQNNINICLESSSFLFNVVCLARKKHQRFDDQKRTSSNLQTCVLKFLFVWISAIAFLHVSSYTDFCSLFSCS